VDIFNQLPCPVLITTKDGTVQAANAPLLTLLREKSEDILHKPMDELMPLASRIFLQTHVFPMLIRDGSVHEIYLKLKSKNNPSIAILLNCTSGIFKGDDCYIWLLFVTQERNKFEQELLVARKRAEIAHFELAKREQFIKTIADTVPGLLGYWDKNLYCRFANKAYLEWFGKAPESIIGMHLRDLLGAPLFSANEPYIYAALAGNPQEFERIITKPDGNLGHTIASYTPDKNDDGDVVGFFAQVSDVTSIKSAQTDLKLAASVFHNTLEGIMITDAAGIIISVNPAFTKITGYSAEEAIGKNPRLLKSNHHKPDFYEKFWHEITNHGHWRGEIWNRRKNGEAYLEWQTISTIRGDADQPIRYVSVFNDITKRWQKDERIRYLAFHDPLTELPNRTLLLERLSQLIAATARQPNNLALLFLDLDGFKSINDNLGHDIGDEVLVIVAQKIQAEIRVSDTVARLGGDEFIVLLSHPIDAEGSANIASRIIQKLNDAMVFRGESVSVGASVGIAMYPDDGHLPVQLIKRADDAMYQAKAKGKGKNQYCFFNNM
jgi:diguanylate cyclase (GGDEF)-like protein/PAS domain S-box-containing protein